MSKLLAGHTAAVTGAGSGIGRGIAEAYAREGATVIVIDSNVDTAGETVAGIRADGGAASACTLDVTDPTQCEEVAAQTLTTVGRISILVNNAGINRRNPIRGERSAVAKDWHDIVSVNLSGVFNVTHAYLEQLRESKGRIVNIASIQSFVHLRTPNSPAYTASKHGVLGLTRALAAELGKDGVRVNAIGPGFIETPLNADARRNNPSMVDTLMQHTPLGRPGRPEDIAGPAVFLASDLSAYVTGSIVMADGGYLSL
ncbi:MAG: SDR family oxidoreductase [Gammaproteobacteria bacterium]|nr:SDR family oxidoreductase [Gammaproteobacteria bacterium]